MIRYALRCADGHAFESWFQSAAAYDSLAARGLLSCASCGSDTVEKALMAPKVAPRSAAPVPDAPMADAPVTPVEARVAALRKKVEAESTYVGPRFAAEARAIHETGEAKAIWGEANPAEVKSLLKDGVPVAPLPFVPKSKVN